MENESERREFDGNECREEDRVPKAIKRRRRGREEGADRQKRLDWVGSGL